MEHPMWMRSRQLLSPSPNTAVVRPDFHLLAILESGVTLDLDKYGHSDSYQNQEASFEVTFSFH